MLPIPIAIGRTLGTIKHNHRYGLITQMREGIVQPQTFYQQKYMTNNILLN